MTHDPSKWLHVQREEGKNRRRAERLEREAQVNERALAKRRQS